MWFTQLVDAIAWPAALVTMVHWLRQPISECLRSLTQRKIAIAAVGVTATIEAGAQQSKEENPATERLTAQPVPDASLSPAVALMEAHLREDLAKLEPVQREPTLLRTLALSRIEGGHEFVYNRIFGSQIAGLKRLNEAGRVTIFDAREFARPFIERHPDIYKDYGFEGWINFLIHNNLVKRDGDHLEITEYGRDFLQNLTAKRLSEIKPL